MKTVRLAGAIFVFFTSLIVVLAFGSTAFCQEGAVTEENVFSRLTDAKTPADYQAIAEYFRGKAADADKQIKMHQSMMKSINFHYQKVGKGGGEAMTRHCQGLIDSYEKAKQNYEAMALDYEQMAKGESAPGKE